MPKHGKKYVESAKLIDRDATYESLEAIELVGVERQRLELALGAPCEQGHVLEEVDLGVAPETHAAILVRPVGAAQRGPRVGR